MSSTPTAIEIARDARWLAQALDPQTGAVRLIEMSSESYRAASFLDDRILQQPVNSAALPWPEVAAAVPADARRDARWIFQIGHVGSTLIARLLGELDGVLSIREPRLLRDFMAMPGKLRPPMVPAIQKLFSRTFAPEEKALVKATSFVGEVAAQLVPPGERALFLYADPRTYIATILAGPNSLKEQAARADGRALRMAERVPGFPPGGGPAQLAAAAWACEMTALEAAAAVMSDRHILWADFDQLLADMEAGLERLADFFGFKAPAERVREIARGPLMSRYSKALEYDYSPELRRQLIDQEFQLQGPAIEAALTVLSNAAKDSPLLAKALGRR
jgi:hypothetical protein